MNIREATKRDFDTWAQMRIQLWPDATAEDHKNEMEKFYPQETFLMLLAEVDGKAVGFLEGNIREFANGCESHPVPFLEGIWVGTKHRKSGVAKALVESFEEWATSKGFSELCSDADLDNTTSHEAHKNWGFVETERVIYYRKSLS